MLRERGPDIIETRLDVEPFLQDSWLKRSMLLPLAAAFLVESWVWDGFIALARRLVALIPWDAVKARVIAIIDYLPTPIVLIFFLVPIIILEPLKLIAVWLMATGHFFLGAVSYIVLQFLCVGLIGVVFDLTRERLLKIGWFAWAHEKVTAFHAFAHRLIAPYKKAALDELRALRRWAQSQVGRATGGKPSLPTDKTTRA